MRGLPSRLGTQAKILYATQVAVAPPTFVVVVNKPELFKGDYERYLRNRLRDDAVHGGAGPVVLSRAAADIEDLLSAPAASRRPGARPGRPVSGGKFSVDGIDDEPIRQIMAEDDED